MRYGVLGTGMVGTTLGAKLVELGHDVCIGSRTPDNEVARAWREPLGAQATQGTFADAAQFGEVVLSCLNGSAAVDVISANAPTLDGKVLIDIANPLDFSTGFPQLDPVSSDSLGERVQRAAPGALVVKTLNNLNAAVMVDPTRVPGQTLFLSGESSDAKDRVRDLLREFGWQDSSLIDLGGIETARATEMMVPLWILLMQKLGTTDFGIHVTK